jgi:tetratricopeptide (TPR) repeat protein
MKNILPILFLVIGLGSLYPMQQWIDARSSVQVISEETLYFSSGKTIKAMSLGLDALVTDVYWIRTVQYFGRKLDDPNVDPNNLKDIRMDLLAPLLRVIVELDPHHLSAYRFGALFLPERDLNSAEELLQFGIRNNPDKWRLYQDLGYIYWQSGQYSKAAETYDRGSALPGAMWWMRDLAGLMRIKGSSRDAARVIYSGYLESEDPRIKEQAVIRLKQLRSLDEIDMLNTLLSRYREQMGTCPGSLRVLAPRLTPLGFALNNELMPIDPEGYEYALDTAACRVTLAPDSTIAR